GGDGGGQGGPGELAGVPPLPEGARAEGGAAVRLGQVPGAGGGAGRVLPRGRLAAVCRSLLPQRLHRGAQGEGQGGGGDAQGDPRPGGPGQRRGEGPGGGRQAGSHAAGEGGGAGAGGDRGNLGVHGLPARALAVPADEQPLGAGDAG